MVRDFIRIVQDLRKSMKLEPRDKIVLTVGTDEKGATLVTEAEDSIRKVVQANAIVFETLVSDTTHQIEDLSFALKIERV